MMSLIASDSWPTFQQNTKKARFQSLATLVMSVLGSLLLFGILLFVRRLGGAFTADLPRSMLLLTAIVSAGVAGSSRVVWRQLFPLNLDNGHSSSWSDQFVGWGSSLALFLMMIGTCFPGEHLSDWFIWLPLLVLDQFWRQDFFDGGHPEYQAGLSLSDVAQELISFEGSSLSPLVEQSDPANCTQQVYRVREQDGQEAVYATLQIEFQTGQRYATAYVGFCPPLPYRPAIEVDPLEGPPAEVKIVQALSHGARLDLKLAVTTECPVQVLIDLAARRSKSSGR